MRASFAGLLVVFLSWGCAQPASLRGSSTGGGAGTSGSGGSGGSAGGSAGGAGSAAGGSAGVAGTAGTGGSAGGGATDASVDGAPDAAPEAGDAGSDAQDPCANVTCNTPPANTCQDATTLGVYSPTGTCSGGACNYVSTPTTCANGCSGGACDGDPCVGVTCNAPPASTCSDSTHLRVYDAPGTCNGGTCSYSSHEAYCGFGCTGDVCNGDPCTGVTCATPPASYCSSASDLTVYDTPGTCGSGGACAYTSHAQYCTYGCSGGACKGDPCAGVTCATPPASYCSDASTLKSYSGPGTCSGGACSYPQSSRSCPGGCVNGVCKDCATAADCGSGKWCNGGSCATCNDDQHCGGSCANCTTSGGVCSGGTSCVQCTVDSQCGSGKWCNAGTCASCNTAQKCGATCAACSGATPDCGGSACVCNATSCGANQACSGGACAVCKSDAACGAACSACGGATPRCLDQGTTSACVGCLSDGDCSGGKTCIGNTCSDACTTLSFSTDFESGAAGFTHDPTSGISGDDPWALGNPSGVTCHSGSKCWATNLSSGGYSNCQMAELISPVIDVSACAGSSLTPTLSFWHYYKFEAKSSGTWWDGGTLQISSDGGATWNDVTPTPGYEGTINGSYGGCTPTPDIGGHAGWSGTIPGGVWVQVSFDLPSQYRVATFRARWLFGADAGTTARGWFIDDVAVTTH